MLFGPDVSGYQAGIDMARVRAEGFDFAFAKATQGSSYRSPAYPGQRDQAIAAGLIFAAYHYVDTSDPVAQARNFMGWVGDRSIAVMFDWEDGGGGVANLRGVVAAFQAAGARCALTYAPNWYWSQQGALSLAGLPPLVASSYPSSAAGYASALYQNVGASRWNGYGGNSVALLQFTDSALIAGLKIDCNAYPGTREQLISLLYGTGAPATRKINTEELVSSQTFDAPAKSIQVEAESGAGSAAFANAWVCVYIPDGMLDVTVYPAYGPPGKAILWGTKQGPVHLDKGAGAHRACFLMPTDNTDCCVQWSGATQPVTVSTVHTPK